MKRYSLYSNNTDSLYRKFVSVRVEIVEKPEFTFLGCDLQQNRVTYISSLKVAGFTLQYAR